MLNCVRELERQLAAERLLPLWLELEGEVVRRIALKGRMCAQIDELTMLLSSAAVADMPPPSADDRPLEGSSSSRTTTIIRREEDEEEGGGGRTLVPGLVSASMIHPSMNAARERANDINATAVAAAHDRAGTSSGIGAAAPPPALPVPSQ